MSFATLLLFVPACFALNMAPGPNNLMALHNAQQQGFRASVLAGVGRLFAFVLMIVLAASGLAVVLLASETLFFTIKLLGAVYLFWLAYKLWQAPVSSIKQSTKRQHTAIKTLAKQECLLALGNPKAILIFTAFLPQFVEPSQAVGSQFVQLGSLFLLLELIAISVYAGIGAFLQSWFNQSNVQNTFNRCCAVLLASLGFTMLLESKVR